MKYKKFFEWLTLDMAVFAAINGLMIYHFQDKLELLDNIGFLEFLVLGLAAFRAANILSNEVVTKPLRAPFVDETQKNGKLVEEPKKSGFLGAFGLLIYCPSCTGVWISAALVYLFLFWPNQTLVIATILALSGLERIFSKVLGWLK